LNMNIIVSESHEKMSEAAAVAIAAQIMAKPDAALGLSAGGVPLGIYDRIVHMHRDGLIDFKWIRAFILSEYVGFGKDAPGSCRHFLMERFLSKTNANAKNIVSPDGAADNPDSECLLYEEKLDAANGIDLILLNLGNDGRIAFNGPGDCFEQATHVASLPAAADARHDASLPDGAESALTVGFGAIMKAKRIILAASGAGSADAVRNMVYGKAKPGIPASILKFHGDVTVITDSEAGMEL
jgi:glucosamine-6-phosphate deaminase